MRDPLRIVNVLRRLQIAWKRYPDLRLGQLLLSVVEDNNQELFYLEDDALIRRIEAYLK